MSVTQLHPEGTFRDEVASRLRQAIAARNLKKQDIADFIAMNQASFSKRVNGRLPIDVDEADTISNAIGIRRNWLLTGDGPMVDPEWVPPAGFEPAAFRSQDPLIFRRFDDLLAIEIEDHDWLAPVVPIGSTVATN